MNRFIIFITVLFLCHTHALLSQNENTLLTHYWQIGIGLGEIPTGGSMKPSITIGYHFNEKLYAGVIYQFKDQISRGRNSFNAQSSQLEGLNSSTEDVSQRFLLHARYTPFKNGPYLSGGLVFNGKDSETMVFDERSRLIAGESFSGTIQIQQTRPAGWGLAMGLGYQYNFKNGISAGFEWTPAWGQYPDPTYVFSGTSNLSEFAREDLTEKMNDGFKSSVTNLYKVFHFGMSYRFH